AGALLRMQAREVSVQRDRAERAATSLAEKLRVSEPADVQSSTSATAQPAETAAVPPEQTVALPPAQEEHAVVAEDASAPSPEQRGGGEPKNLEAAVRERSGSLAVAEPGRREALASAGMTEDPAGDDKKSIATLEELLHNRSGTQDKPEIREARAKLADL